jgi:hypothetical protein
MTGTPEVLRERAEHHAKEAERLLKSWWLSTHVKAQVHATLAAGDRFRAESRLRPCDAPLGCRDRLWSGTWGQTKLRPPPT